MFNKAITTVVLAATLTVIAACGGNASVPTITVDGSSTVFPLSEAVAEEFGKRDQQARVTVDLSGTGGGFQKFCRAETDVTGASRPITPTEVEVCAKSSVRYVEVPIAYDGLAVVVHPSNTWVDHLTVAELRRMWEPAAERKITRWSHIRSSWPDRELKLFGAGSDSGTYDYFTAAIMGQEHSSRGDYTASEDDDELVQGVAGNENALGFFGYAYFQKNRSRLRLVSIDDENSVNGAGPIAPSPETVNGGAYQPLSRPIFFYVSAASLERPEVAKFAQFYLEHSPKLSAEVGYIALPARAYELASQRLAARTVGSIFGGHGSQVGVKVEELMEKAVNAR